MVLLYFAVLEENSFTKEVKMLIIVVQVDADYCCISH